jgi:pimeloyl-ACP methyl ester carboxylesterase
VLSGHSWGGTIAITAAARRPGDVAGLVLFDSGHIDYCDVPDARPEATIEELIAELQADPVPDTWDGLVALLAEQGLDRP